MEISYKNYSLKNKHLFNTHIHLNNKFIIVYMLYIIIYDSFNLYFTMMRIDII